MSNEAKASLRLPAELAERVEKVRALVEKANPGLEVPTSAAIRMALDRGLAQLEAEYSRRQR